MTQRAAAAAEHRVADMHHRGTGRYTSLDVLAKQIRAFETRAVCTCECLCAMTRYPKENACPMCQRGEHRIRQIQPRAETTP